jgi:uncharacterized protein YbjT (DUF2867 family)
MTQRVLLAGATGRLGGRIAHHLLEEPDTELRLLVRPESLSDSRKARTISSLVERGAVVAHGGVTDRASLEKATKNVDVVISAVQGGPEIIVDGQLALVDAAKMSGVRRVMPADFAGDLFEAPEGGHALLDMRRTVDRVIAAGGIEHVHVLNGFFMDGLLASFFEVYDLEAGTARTWGEGDERFDVTSIEDAARYAARAAVDRQVPSGKFAVTGQRISFDEMTDAIERVTCRRLRRERLGSVADLRAWIADRGKRANGPTATPPFAAIFQLYALTGVTALRDLQNLRYPDIHPESFEAFVRRAVDES